MRKIYETPYIFREDVKAFKQSFSTSEWADEKWEKVKQVIALLQNKPAEEQLPQVYNDHPLEQPSLYLNLGCWDCHIFGPASDCVLIYKIDESKHTLVLYRIGTHTRLGVK